MKLRKTPKKQCQNEPWDLSIRHSDQSVDVSAKELSLDNTNMSKEQVPVHDEEQLTPIPEPGENVEVGCFGEMAVPVNQQMETDDLCYTVSEVKLYRLTNSELEKYLGKLPNKNYPTARAKGDNNGTASITNTEQSSKLTHPASPCPTQHTQDQVDLCEQQLLDKRMQTLKIVTVMWMQLSQKWITKHPDQNVAPQDHLLPE